MALIDPFRKLIVYPSLLRSVHARWNQAFGTGWRGDIKSPAREDVQSLDATLRFVRTLFEVTKKPFDIAPRG